MSETDESLARGEWSAALPPEDFTDRVMARIEAMDIRAASPRRWRYPLAGSLSAVAIAAALFLWWSAPSARGEKIAQERVEIAIGSRALAVLEPDAQVSWNGDDVDQTRGAVFYRVERSLSSRAFNVHTPAGNVTVKGTCFTVKVRGALALVALHEGKVSLSHGDRTLDLQAGELAQLGADGIERLGHDDGERRFEEAALSAAKSDALLGRANENLVRQVSEVRARLESVSAQKAGLEAKLKSTEERLAAARDGGPAPWSSDFDPSPDAWKELAKDGSIKYDVPCLRREAWSPSAETVRELGLGVEDGQALKGAFERSHARMWATVKPLCTTAVGSTELAEKFGVSTCMYLVLDIEHDRDPRAAADAQRLVSEVRAGTRAMPDDGNLHPLAKLFLATTGEGHAFERDLAQTLGPEEARRVRFADDLCRTQHIFSGSKR